MKKRFLGLMAMVVIAVVAAWNVNQSKNEMALNDVALANIEALAREWSNCTAFDHCGTNCPYEWCGYCDGFYMPECVTLIVEIMNPHEKIAVRYDVIGGFM